MRHGFVYLLCRVSIHAPREGCDGVLTKFAHKEIKFQFTHPGRGATASSNDRRYLSVVSIHAPREGCDFF